MKSSKFYYEFAPAVILILSILFTTFGFAEKIRKRSVCQDYEVPCSNGVGCLHLTYLCNGRAECTDGSDEGPEWCKDNCSTIPNMFRCADNSCISKKFVCDGSRTCKDGSDETLDICHSCFGDPTKFKCQNGTKCVDRIYRCDSDLDCSPYDESDEDPAFCRVYCKGFPDRFQCKNEKCINNYKICDGQPDCEDGSDETIDLCKNCNGDPERFKCRISGKCIWTSSMCDEIDDCSITTGTTVRTDTSDEDSCTKTTEPSVYRYSWEGKK